MLKHQRKDIVISDENRKNKIKLHTDEEMQVLFTSTNYNSINI